MQIIVIIFFVIILFIFLFLSLSSDEDDEDQKRIAGKEGELQAKKILNHYLNENDLDIMIVPTDFKYVYDGSPIEKQLENYYQKNNSILNYEGKLVEPVDINND